jgi:O-antigen/teichoic acid export membrane protein
MSSLKSTSQLSRRSLVLLAGNVATGMLTYGFQLRASAVLDTASYGSLNVWMAYLSIFISVATIAQIASNFHLLDSTSLLKLCKKVLLTLALILLFLVFFGINGSSGVKIGLLTCILAVLFQFILGQFQGRLWFFGMVVSSFIAAAAKFGSTYCLFGNHSIQECFYYAFPLSFGVGCLAEITFVFSMKKKLKSLNPNGFSSSAEKQKKRLKWTEMGASVLLAFGMALIPQIDLLNIHWTQPAPIVGRFSQASLFAKGIYFAALTLLQITLPYHIQTARGELEPESFAKVKKFERFGLVCCILGSFIFAGIGPEICRKILGFDVSQHRDWILLSCLCLTALYNQLQKLQLACTTYQLDAAVLRTGALGLGMLVSYLWQPKSVTAYLISALGYYLVLHFTPFRSPRIQHSLSALLKKPRQQR